MENLIVVLEGPSGAGKDSVIQGLIAKYPDIYEKIISYTTRDIRPYESEGNPYFFVSTPIMEAMIQTGEVFEYTMRHGTYRAMAHHVIDDILNRGKTPIKDCDPVGVTALKKAYPTQVLAIFLKAPKAEIKKRLISRGDTKAEIQCRLNDYDEYLKNETLFDHSVENVVLDATVTIIHEIITKRKQAAG